MTPLVSWSTRRLGAVVVVVGEEEEEEEHKAWTSDSLMALWIMRV